MDVTSALDWASTRRHATLITIRADGRPQSSDIVYAVDGDSILISVTRDRAKTANIMRDPRVVLHVSEPASWSYLSFDGTATLSSVTTRPDDPTSDQLVDYYRAVSGEDHSDWDEYRRAMIDEGRQLIRFTPTSVVGQVNR